MKGRLSLVTVGLAGPFLLRPAPARQGAVGCGGRPQFTSCTLYASGAQVVYNGSLYHSIVGIPADRDCPPVHPFNPGNDNWWVKDGTCSGPTSTPKNGTPTSTVTATATRTPTATPLT